MLLKRTYNPPTHFLVPFPAARPRSRNHHNRTLSIDEPTVAETHVRYPHHTLILVRKAREFCGKEHPLDTRLLFELCDSCLSTPLPQPHPGCALAGP
jgi:hypothetical protein